MAYNKTKWENGKTPLNENNLNKIEDGIANADALSTDNENRIDVIEEALKNTELSYNEDTNFISIKIAADEKEENKFADTGVNITMKASDVSFDSSRISGVPYFVRSAGKYEYEHVPGNGVPIIDGYSSFICRDKYGNSKDIILLPISRTEMVQIIANYNETNGYTYGGLIYDTSLNVTSGDSFALIIPRKKDNVQDIIEELSQEHVPFETIYEQIQKSIPTITQSSSLTYNEVQNQHVYLLDCNALPGLGMTGIVHIVPRHTYSIYHTFDITFLGIKVNGNYNDKSPLYNIKTYTSKTDYTASDSLHAPDLVSSIVIKMTDENIVGANLNVENGTGTNAVQMKQDGTSGVFDFTGKNPNATEIDETLTGEIPYGATGNFATVVGGKASAQGKRSMAQGTTTIAKGAYSHAEGDNSVAYGNDSHAEGYATTAYGKASHAEGNNTAAGGEISHVEGFNNKTTITAVGAHAEGAHNIARGEYSHVGGLHNEANMAGQFVVGHCNDNKEDTAFEVGCGWTDENGNIVQKRNAFEVYLDGHAEVLAVGNTENSVVNIKTLNKIYTDINEKLEGKKNTYVLNCGWDIDYLKDCLSKIHNLRIEDAYGNNISQAILNGEYDNIAIQNEVFRSNKTPIYLDPVQENLSYTIVLKPTNDSGSVNYPPAETFIVDMQGRIYKPGDTILITQTDVPDRWFAGYWGGFYALESRKFEMGATNLQNGREGTKSVQGGTDVIANYDGDIVFGTGLETTTENQAAFGKYNAVDWNYTNGRPLFTVGNGTNANNRSTAFEVYDNGNAVVKENLKANSADITELSVGGPNGKLKFDVDGEGEFANIYTNSFLTLMDGNSNSIFMSDEGTEIRSENYISLFSDSFEMQTSDCIYIITEFGTQVNVMDDGVWIESYTPDCYNYITVNNGGINLVARQIIFEATAKVEDENGGYIFGMLDDENQRCELTIDNRSYGDICISADRSMHIGGSWNTKIFNKESNNNIIVAEDGLYFNGNSFFQNCAGFEIFSDSFVANVNDFRIYVADDDDDKNVGNLKVYTKLAMFSGSVFLENPKSDIYVVGNDNAYIVGEDRAMLCSGGDPESADAYIEAAYNEARIYADYVSIEASKEMNLNAYSDININSGCVTIGKKGNRTISIEDDFYFEFPDFRIILSEYITPTLVPTTWVDGATFTYKEVFNFIKTHSIIQYSDGETVFELKNCMGNVGGKLKGQDITIGDDGVVTIKTVEFNFNPYKLAAGLDGFKLSIISKTKTLESL